MNNDFYIGCSGYYYPQWKNSFYPSSLKPVKWLEFYSTVFNAVELNGTFYRIPKLKDLERYNSVTPDDFIFSVKVNKYITHVLRLKESKSSIEEFKDLIKKGLAGKFHYLLFQFPSSFHYSESNMDLIIDSIGKGSENIIEFRHISWWNKIVFERLQNRFIKTTDNFYLRLHGTPLLFKSSYSENQLQHFHSHMPANCNSYAVFFNNTYYDAAYKNALELKKLIQ